MNREGLVYTAVVTFVVAFVFVGILAFANEVTREKAETNALLFERRAILNAMGIDYTGDTAVLETYAREVRESAAGGEAIMEATVDGRPVRAVRFTGSGLWGRITGVLAVRPDLSRIVGLDIVDHNETPGLGGRIAEPWFREQFRGERITGGEIRVVKAGGSGDTDHDNGKVDGVTGASRTSDAMGIMLNRTLKMLAERL